MSAAEAVKQLEERNAHLAEHVEEMAGTGKKKGTTKKETTKK
jgi:hypothetical protein